MTQSVKACLLPSALTSFPYTMRVSLVPNTLSYLCCQSGYHRLSANLDARFHKTTSHSISILSLQQQQQTEVKMDALFTEQQLFALETKIWWVACNVTPFLIRSAILNNTILLNITDLKTLWGTRVDEKKLMKDKEIYARTLEVSSAKELIALFEGILSNSEQKALYKFIKKTTGDLTFEIEKQIEVYPLTWKFQLLELDSEMANMICRDIVNPLARTLNAQEKRIEIMRRKIKILQDNLLKRMTETEKGFYKSALNEDEEDLKLLVRGPKEEEFITELNMEARSRMFFEMALTGQKSMRMSEKMGQKEKTMRVQKRGAGFNAQLNADQIINELEMKKEDEREKKKKKKNHDFI